MPVESTLLDVFNVSSGWMILVLLSADFDSEKESQGFFCLKVGAFYFSFLFVACIFKVILFKKVIQTTRMP